MPRSRRRPRPAASRTSTRTASATTAAWSSRCARSRRRTQPDIIFGDSFGNEEAVRAVAADYPDIPFVFGSGGGPAEPNFSVFDNWIHEPAYLAGWLAGGLTKSDIIGVVAGYPVPEVNRITNAFIAGAQAKNPEVEVKVTFINSWFDPATAKEAALAQIAAGADVLYAERAGVIEAAKEQGVLVVGNMADQQADAPENVITSVTWNMTPTVEYVVDQVLAGSYTSQDLKDFSMMAKGGAALAPINAAVDRRHPARSSSTRSPPAEASIQSGRHPRGHQRGAAGRFDDRRSADASTLTGTARSDGSDRVPTAGGGTARRPAARASPSASGTSSRTTTSTSTSGAGRSMPCWARTAPARRP